uniref:Large ribosomal subunit protein bL33m n=1 Tax=Oryzias sinensis TaxID=183150 RepID=A0A8C7ZTB5_9TELE
MFLTTVNLAKAKSKTILVQMVSAAGTGYCFNTKRNRLREKLVLRKHDPFGELSHRSDLHSCRSAASPRLQLNSHESLFILSKLSLNSNVFCPLIRN